MIEIETCGAVRVGLSANKFLREFYLEWVNNYLTVDKMAEHNSITAKNCAYLINAGQALHEEYVEMRKHDKD